MGSLHLYQNAICELLGYDMHLEGCNNASRRWLFSCTDLSA